MTTGSWRAVDPECFLVGWKIHHTAACPLRVRRSPPLALAPFDPLLIGPVDGRLAGDTKPLRVVRDRALSDRRLAPPRLNGRHPDTYPPPAARTLSTRATAVRSTRGGQTPCSSGTLVPHGSPRWAERVLGADR